jgi:hypothetical protein
VIWLGDVEQLALTACVDDDEARGVIVCVIDSEGDCACDGDAVTSCDGVDVSEGELEALGVEEGVNEPDAVDDDDGVELGVATWLCDCDLLTLTACVDEDEPLSVAVCERVCD